jgi:hypothetical protein
MITRLPDGERVFRAQDLPILPSTGGPGLLVVTGPGCPVPQESGVNGTFRCRLAAPWWP